MNRAARREAERALRRGDPVALKLAGEYFTLRAAGLADDAGEVICPDCGAVVDRELGWRMVFECACGWTLIEDDPLEFEEFV